MVGRKNAPHKSCLMENFKEKFKSNKTSQISVRMTPMERMFIENRAKKSGRSMSQFMVESSLGKEMKILSEEEKKAYLDLSKYHFNFSRIGNLFKQGSDIKEEILATVAEIKKTLEIIQNGK
jgi:uncharacterized protein (DUF1778 family)